MPTELFTARQWHALAKKLGLSPRQLQMAQLVCRGMKTDAIARKLGISPNTVRTHMKGLFGRIGVRDRASVVVALVVVSREQLRTYACRRKRKRCTHTNV